MADGADSRAPVLPAMVEAAEVERLSSQELFDRYFEGVWKPRWWRRLIGVEPPQVVKVKSYRTGEVTGELRTAIGITEDGDRYEFHVQGRTSIPGWRKVGTTPQRPDDLDTDEYRT